jgi:hypothetical protein
VGFMILSSRGRPAGRSGEDESNDAGNGWSALRHRLEISWRSIAVAHSANCKLSTRFSTGGADTVTGCQ